MTNGDETVYDVIHVNKHDYEYTNKIGTCSWNLNCIALNTIVVSTMCIQS